MGRKVSDELRIGVICRCNNGGLGNQSFEFYSHMGPVKTLVVMFPHETNYVERYPDAQFVITSPNRRAIDWLLEGIDVLVGFETFYDIEIVKIARRRGIKTVLQPNWEWLDKYGDNGPDLFLAPSKWYYNELPEPKELLVVPINRKKLQFKERKRAKVFLHNAGNGLAGYDRNGTEAVMEAIPLVQSDVKFIVKTQGCKLEDIGDSRVEYLSDDIENYHESWPDADVMVYPRRYGGLSLMLNEAMSQGIVPLMTDMEPQREFLPKKLLIDVKEFTRIKVNNAFLRAEVEPAEIAKKIDAIAGQDIRLYSNYVDRLAEDLRWDKMKEAYRAVLRGVVDG